MERKTGKETPKALVFDAFGTLFDVDSVTAACDDLFPRYGKQLSKLWRTKQLEYSWLFSLMGHYEDFWEITGRALVFACGALKLPCDSAGLDRLRKTYLRLNAYPEVSQALNSLSAFPLAILSNGSPMMLRELVENAGLKGIFEHTLSADEAGVYKPSPRVYHLASQRFGLDPGSIGFVSSNSWDVAGAKSFGFRSYWVNRSDLPGEELSFHADLTVESLHDLATVLDEDRI